VLLLEVILRLLQTQRGLCRPSQRATAATASRSGSTGWWSNLHGRSNRTCSSISASSCGRCRPFVKPLLLPSSSSSLKDKELSGERYCGVLVTQLGVLGAFLQVQALRQSPP